MREALGWGLGDAHEWVHLTDMGFSRRPPGALAEPGDITVWPFTYGSRGSQHIGIAVGTTCGIRLLSNLSGTIRLSDLVPGYQAFYKLVSQSAPTGLMLQPTVASAPHTDLDPAPATSALGVSEPAAGTTSRPVSSSPTSLGAAPDRPSARRSRLVFDPGVPAPLP